ncbi:MAG: DUF5684 domain-containing protein [Oscillospiraceae bacterium]
MESNAEQIYVYEQAPYSPLAMFLSLAVAIFLTVCLWKIFTKAGAPGWAAIIPFYNMYVLFKITWGCGWKFLFMIIPVVNIVFYVLTYIKLAKAFGKGTGFAWGLIFLSLIFMPMLAFGNAKYLGIPA